MRRTTGWHGDMQGRLSRRVGTCELRQAGQVEGPQARQGCQRPQRRRPQRRASAQAEAHHLPAPCTAAAPPLPSERCVWETTAGPWGGRPPYGTRIDDSEGRRAIWRMGRWRFGLQAA